MGMEIDLTVLVRLMLSSFLGGLIGLEREVHGRPAGFRTHLLVSLGSCLFVITSIEFYRLYGDFSGRIPVGVDPARVAAQVVTGIGFLGAGAIIREKASIRGLTTAACLWVAAAVGLACGTGLFGASVVVTGLALVSLLLLKKVENRLSRDSYIHITVWSVDREALQEKLEQLLIECDMQVMNVSIEKDVIAKESCFEFEARCRSRKLSSSLVDSIGSLEGIKRVRVD
jgi:putative Mg2+ transporter-C (MgtC) family protein